LHGCPDVVDEGSFPMVRLLLVSILVAVPLSSAQRPVVTDYTLNVDVELVQLPISVVDKEGYPVRGLRREHFKIYEDRVMQDIAVFKQEDVPVSVGLVLDSSGSMRDEKDRLRTAALTFVEESNPEDETFIVSFSDRPGLEQDFTSDPRVLGVSLDRMVAHGNTSLYDAVLFAASHMEKGVQDKKALVLVSDGQDNRSRYKLDEVLEELRESKIILYTVGLMTPEMRFLENWPFKVKARKALEKFAQVTGGRAFFPKSIDEVNEICRNIARDLRSQYTIGYKPSNDKLDGSWRKVTVQVSPPRGTSKVRVHTKQGYYAPTARKFQKLPTANNDGRLK
jgi:Ca-activated chloride channel homolog